MTTTTKVFVILVCLFALIFTPMAIQFAAQTNNWRKLAEDWSDHAESAYANERSVLAIAASETGHFKQLRDEEHRRLLESQKRIDELEQRIAELTQTTAELDRRRAGWETSAQVLTGEMAVKSGALSVLTDAKEKALENERRVRTENNDLNTRVRELTAQIVVMSQQLNQKEQVITTISKENEQLRRSLNMGKAGEIVTVTPTPSAQAIAPVAMSPVRCQVTDVNGQLATISAGSASGLEQGVLLVVLRDKEYICDLEVTSNITPNEAVGRIKLESGKRIRTGDEVIDETSFLAQK